MGIALIIAGGEFDAAAKNIEYDYVIACDRGAEYAKRMGIKPDVIVGDFDSYDGDIKADNPGIKIEKFPVQKDDTDTMLAIRHAFLEGYEHMILVCAMGGQTDHFVANLQSLRYIADHGGTGEIISENEHLRTITAGNGRVSFEKRPGYGLSVFSLTDISEGVTIGGAEYSTDNITLSSGFPLGHGNTITDSCAVVSLRTGVLLAVESRRPEH